MGLYHAAHNPADLVNVLKTAKEQAKDKYDVPAVRLGVLLALRKHKSAKCATFLPDTDPRIVAEAARAVYDVRIADAMPALAKLAEKPGQPDAVAFRALAANYQLGTPEAAARVANFAAKQGEPDYARAFALKLLGNWSKPPRRDPIMGVTLDLPPRDEKIATEALLKAGAGIFAGSDVVRKEAAQTVAKLNAKEFGSALAAFAWAARYCSTFCLSGAYSLSLRVVARASAASRMSSASAGGTLPAIKSPSQLSSR
jgi:quinoprotein glucose dehydrogenase